VGRTLLRSQKECHSERSTTDSKDVQFFIAMTVAAKLRPDEDRK